MRKLRLMTGFRPSVQLDLRPNRANILVKVSQFMGKWEIGWNFSNGRKQTVCHASASVSARQKQFKIAEGIFPISFQNYVTKSILRLICQTEIPPNDSQIFVKRQKILLSCLLFFSFYCEWRGLWKIASDINRTFYCSHEPCIIFPSDMTQSYLDVTVTEGLVS